MSKFAIGAAVLLFLLWLCWCFFAITVLVPIVRMHITFWDWLMAWVLSVLPVMIAAIAFLIVNNRRRRV